MLWWHICVCSGTYHICRSQKTTLGDVPWVLPTFLTEGPQSSRGCCPMGAEAHPSPSPWLGLLMCTTRAGPGARTQVLMLVRWALPEQSCLLSNVSCCWGFFFGGGRVLAVEAGFSVLSDLEPIILSPWPSGCWNYRYAPSYVGCRLIVSILGDVDQRQ